MFCINLKINSSALGSAAVTRLRGKVMHEALTWCPYVINAILLRVSTEILMLLPLRKEIYFATLTLCGVEHLNELPFVIIIFA